MQNKKLSQIGNDNESLMRKTWTQEKYYPKKDEKAINIKVVLATLFPEKDVYRCLQAF
jgi:hypothetical protein